METDMPKTETPPDPVLTTDPLTTTPAQAGASTDPAPTTDPVPTTDPAPTDPLPDPVPPEVPVPAANADPLPTTPADAGASTDVELLPPIIDFPRARFLIGQVSLFNNSGHRDGFWDELKALHGGQVETTPNDEQALTICGITGAPGASREISLENWANAARRALAPDAYTS
jgi:hypothetical protein